MSLKGEYWEVKDKHSLESFKAAVDAMYAAKGHVIFHYQQADRRTAKQNAAMWLWLTQLAAALNAAGYDMKKTLKPHVEIPWTKDLAKEYLWDPIQLIVTQQESSREISRSDIDLVQETIARHLAQTTGVSVPFPKRP